MTRSIASERLLRTACFVAVCATLSTCSDATRPDPRGGSGGTVADKIRDGLLLSGPLHSRAGAVASGVTPDTAVIFVSMVPGTLASGDSVRLATVNGIGRAASATIGNGGFDPVPILAAVDDSLDVSVFDHGAVTVVRARVPGFRQPSVIRTTPARGRTDVPLNQQIVIVFSQPIDATTVTPTTVQVVANGTPVTATINVQVGQPWLVFVTPTAVLAPNTTYQIVVSKDAYSNIALSYFTAVRAIPGATVPFVAYKVSAGGDTLIDATGLPVTWSSSPTSVATIDATGLATAVAPGVAAISGCSGAICGQRSITVEEPDQGIRAQDLGDFGGGQSYITRMRGGFLTGSASLPAGQDGSRVSHAFLWSKARGMEDIGAAIGGSFSGGALVNIHEVVVIGSDIGLFIWTRSTGAKPLTSPDSLHAPWFPVALTAQGEVLFESSVNDNVTVLGMWNPTTGPRVIRLRVPNAYAQDMNDVGQGLLGTLSSGDDHSDLGCGKIAYVWNANFNKIVSTLVATDSVTGAPMPICPYAINDHGVVSGTVNPVDPRAFRWSASTGFKYLQPPDASPSWGKGLNQSGDIAVYFAKVEHDGADSLYITRGAAWMASGEVIPLASLGGLTLTDQIDDSRLVAGDAYVGSTSGNLHAVVWDLSGASPSRSPLPSRTLTKAPASKESHARSAPAALVPRKAATRKPPL